MEIKYLEELIVLSDLKSSYAAAEELFISQSTLVRHIQSVEEELGMPLFERTKRGFVLNDAGRTFLPYARRIVRENDQSYRMLHRGLLHGKTVRIASDCRIIDLLADFRKTFPEYTVDFCTGNDSEEELQRGDLDVAFLIRKPERMQYLTCIPFLEEEVKVLLYEDHDLYDYPELSLELLKEENLILRTGEPFLNMSEFNNACREAGLFRGQELMVPESADVVRLVRDRAGIALIHGAPGEISSIPGLKMIPVSPGIHYGIDLCYARRKEMPEAVSAFTEHAVNWRARQKVMNQSLVN